MELCWRGYPGEVILELLKMGADPTLQENTGKYTAAHLAAFYDNVSALKALLKFGGKNALCLNVKTKGGDTPLDWAKYLQKKASIDFLEGVIKEEEARKEREAREAEEEKKGFLELAILVVLPPLLQQCARRVEISADCGVVVYQYLPTLVLRLPLQCQDALVWVNRARLGHLSAGAPRAAFVGIPRKQ
mgnify:CR=1 FL=1